MQSIRLELCATSASQKAATASEFSWEALSENRPPYEFEQFDMLDDYHMYCAVNEEFGETITFEETKSRTKERLQEQKLRLKTTRATILQSHMQFELAEYRDRERSELFVKDKQAS